jgi:hypothetical protein
MSNRGRSRSRALRWLALLSIFVGALSVVSYASGAAFMLRVANPALGAWWDGSQFYFMEGAATALGLIVAIRVGQGLITDSEIAARCTLWSGILAAVTVAPLMQVCSTAARLGPEAFGFAAQDWVIQRAGYTVGQQLDKLLIAGVYFLKTTCLALIAGFALVAIVVAVLFATGVSAEVVPSDSSAQS